WPWPPPAEARPAPARRGPEEDASPMQLSREHLEAAFRLKYGGPSQLGPSPRLRARVGDFTPDDVYEGLVSQLVHDGVAWLDVGGGRDVSPSNPALARALAARCGRLVGVDPSANVEATPFVHERVRSTIEEYTSDCAYALAPLRMVAEPLTRPEDAV